MSEPGVTLVLNDATAISDPKVRTALSSGTQTLTRKGLDDEIRPRTPGMGNGKAGVGHDGRKPHRSPRR